MLVHNLLIRIRFYFAKKQKYRLLFSFHRQRTTKNRVFMKMKPRKSKRKIHPINERISWIAIIVYYYAAPNHYYKVEIQRYVFIAITDFYCFLVIEGRYGCCTIVLLRCTSEWNSDCREIIDSSTASSSVRSTRRSWRVDFFVVVGKFKRLFWNLLHR
jgi:hypothetical protein